MCVSYVRYCRNVSCIAYCVSRSSLHQQKTGDPVKERTSTGGLFWSRPRRSDREIWDARSSEDVEGKAYLFPVLDTTIMKI